MVEAETTNDSLVNRCSPLGFAVVDRPPVVNNGAVASNEVYLTRAAVALSIILVLLLGGLAMFSVFGGAGVEPVDIAVPDDEEDQPPPTAYRGERYTFDDRSQALTIGCVPTVGNTDVYVVSITNQADIAFDYLVVARLTPESGAPVEASVDIPDLQPTEAREVVLVPDSPIDDIDECTITAIEGDRRVLLINS
jgi:hypothetical protein